MEAIALTPLQKLPVALSNSEKLVDSEKTKFLVSNPN